MRYLQLMQKAKLFRTIRNTYCTAQHIYYKLQSTSHGGQLAQSAHLIPCTIVTCVPEVSGSQWWLKWDSVEPVPELPSSPMMTAPPLPWHHQAPPLEMRWAWLEETPPPTQLHSPVLPMATLVWACLVHSLRRFCFSLFLLLLPLPHWVAQGLNNNNHTHTHLVSLKCSQLHKCSMSELLWASLYQTTLLCRIADHINHTCIYVYVCNHSPAAALLFLLKFTGTSLISSNYTETTQFWLIDWTSILPSQTL